MLTQVASSFGHWFRDKAGRSKRFASSQQHSHWMRYGDVSASVSDSSQRLVEPHYPASMRASFCNDPAKQNGPVLRFLQWPTQTEWPGFETFCSDPPKQQNGPVLRRFAVTHPNRMAWFWDVLQWPIETEWPGFETFCNKQLNNGAKLDHVQALTLYLMLNLNA